MYKIQVLNSIAPIGLDLLPQNLYEISGEMQQPDAILLRSFNMHGMTFPDTLQIVGRAGAGVNNIPVASLTAAGIPVMNTPGANANAVRELVLAGMLLASRNICQAWNYTRQLASDDNKKLDAQIEQDKKQFVGFELLGKTLGVIGLGSIGVKVANAANHLGMRIIGYDPTITVNRAWELSSDVKQAVNLQHLLKEADFISVHVPLIDATRNMISADQFAVMKSGAVLLNFSRDGIIDNDALLHALRDKKIHSYVTDFPNLQLKDFPNVICLPHLGASTIQAEENCAQMIVKQVRDFLEQGSIINSVNFPTTEVPLLEEGARIVIVNENIPNMVAQISATLAAEKMNINSLINKSRENIAYTVIDVNQHVNDTLLKKICGIKGVIRVRKI